MKNEMMSTPAGGWVTNHDASALLPAKRVEIATGKFGAVFVIALASADVDRAGAAASELSDIASVFGTPALGAHADLMISSPYVRATQTAAIFAGALDYPEHKIRHTETLLPGSEPAALLRELAREKNASSVFCFGHAPHVDALLAAAAGAQRHITSMKKAGVAFVELKRISPPNGQLVWLVTPKLFRKTK